VCCVLCAVLVVLGLGGPAACRFPPLLRFTFAARPYTRSGPGGALPVDSPLLGASLLAASPPEVPSSLFFLFRSFRA
jgi:hypothetical protein